jgi:hypothetical protein
VTPSSIYNKQSSPSTDQDYSSLTETTTHSKPSSSPSSSSSSLELKEESIEQPMKLLNITTNANQPLRHYSPVNKFQTEPLIPMHDSPIKASHQNFPNTKPSITESMIGNIDGYIQPNSINVEHDFDIHDIEEVMEIMKTKEISDENTMHMDNDSLENSEGVLEEQKKSSSTKKSGGYVSAFYLAEKQKFQQEQVANRKRSATNLNRYSSRSTTLPDLMDANKKDKQQRRKPVVVSQRSQSSELIEKGNDISKLDRDSGFDEQDFRRERLHSNGDDNSSISSIKSARSSTIRSMNLDMRENKSYELRMKKLDAKRNSNATNSSLTTQRNLNLSSASRRGSESIPPIPTTNKYRKNSQPIVNLKQQPQK